MKRLLLFTLVATLFAACSKDGVNERNNDRSHAIPDMLYASIDAEDATRVQLNELQKTVWTEGDRLSVFYFSNGNTPFVFNGKTGDREGGFRATSLVEGSTGIDKIVSIYPYSETYTMNTDNKYVSVKLPATQHYLEGSYGVGDNLIAYVGKDGTNLSHKNLCGWIKIQLTGSDTVTKITLKGNDGEQLAGDVKFYYEDFRLEPLTQGGLIIGEYIETITIDCGNGVTLDAETPTEFYFVVAPQTFANGFTVDIEAADGTIMTKSTTKTVTIERNHIQPMTAFDYQGIFQQANNKIWYTNGSTSNPTTPTGSNAFGGATMLSNLYDDKKECWVITFDKDVTTIGQGAFSSCTSLTSINIPESVTTIGKYAFHECTSLTSVNIPCRIAKIEDSTFWECTSLTSVTIPDSVTSIGDCAFWECASLTNITIPESVTTIGEYAFGDCTSLTNITIPNSVTEIGQSAFNGCNGLTSVSIGNNVTEIGTFAFYGCSRLTSVTISDSVTEIGGYTFSFCESLTSVTIPNVVTSIGEYAFQGCTSLTNITIPDSVTTIGNSAFSGCSSLTSICIPNGVTSIGNSAFKSCYALEEVYCKPTTPPTGGSNMFGSTVLAPDKIYVPSASVSAYKNATGWSTYADTIIGYDFEAGKAMPELGIYDTAVDPDKYLVYVANHSVKFGLTSSRDYNVWDTYFENLATGICVAEYKFQLPEVTDEWTPISDDYIEIMGSKINVYNGYRYNNYDERVSVYTKFDLSTIGVEPTDVITLRIDDINDIVTINGIAMEGAIQHAMAKYIYSSYYSEWDEGAYRQYSGITEGTKLYYAKGWDSYGRLQYVGYAGIATNPDTGNEEACWKAQYYTNNSVFETDTFANNRYLSGEYVPLGMGNLQ